MIGTYKNIILTCFCGFYDNTSFILLVYWVQTRGLHSAASLKNTGNS